MGKRDELLSNCRLVQQVLCDQSAIDAEIAELHREIEIVSELTSRAIYENARVAVSQEEFSDRHTGYIERYRKATERLAELDEERRERHNKMLLLEAFIKDIETRPLVVDEFDEKLWLAAVNKVTVLADGRLLFSFKDGTEIEG